MSIEVKDLKKKFFKKEAVKGATFTIEPESIIGLLGRNGAGKSTVLNMIARRIEKTSGDITLDGVDLHKTASAMHEVYLSSSDNCVTNSSCTDSSSAKKSNKISTSSCNSSILWKVL